MGESLNRLLEPIKLGSLTIRNRIVLAPMGTHLVSADGSVSERLIDYHTQYAKGGVGIIIPEGMVVDDKASSPVPNGFAIHHVRFIPGLSLLVDAVKDEGAAIFAEIAHAGHQTTTEITGGYTPVAPSAVASKFIGEVPRELTHEEIIEIQENFGASAKRAEMAGFDGTLIHGGNGYLLTEFLSPRVNKRKDQYGGSLENRARMALGCYEKIREQTSSNFVVGYRISASERLPGGVSIDDVIKFVKLMAARGLDFIEVTSSTFDSIQYLAPVMYLERGTNLKLAAKIKEAVEIPVLCVGGLTPQLAEQAIVDGIIDMAVIGRGHLADPELSLKLTEGRLEDIRPCIRCNQSCMGRQMYRRTISCDVNPALGKNDTFTRVSPDQRKNIIVIGGGVSGMEAARLAAERGHLVTLIEKTAELGGNLLVASVPDFKQDLKPLLAWQKTQLDKLGVNVRLNTEGTPDLVVSDNPDVLIVAVGSEYVVPDTLSEMADKMLYPEDILVEQKPLGENVVMIGGGFIACELALYLLASRGIKVTIFEKKSDLLSDVDEPLTMMALRMQMATSGIKARVKTEVIGCTGQSLTLTDKEGNTEQMKANSIIMTAGLGPRVEIVKQFEGLAPEVHYIGHCYQPHTVSDATRIGHAFRTARLAILKSL